MSPQYDAVKDLCNAVTCAAKGLGIVVKFDIENQIPVVDHRPTLVAGLAASLEMLQVITKCANINPQEIVNGVGQVPQPAQAGRIIIASR